MRYGLWGLAALFIGAFGAHFLLQDRGYVLISFRSFVIEMSVPILILVLLVLYALIRLALKLWRAPRRLGEAIADRRHRRAGEKLTRGLIHMTEGDWTRSERLLTEGLKGGDAPLVNYLMAARAAQLQGSRERRNEWLTLAYESLPDAQATVLLTQAELQFEDQEYEHALATLQRVFDKHDDHPAALALLGQTELALGDRDSLVDLLPRMAKAKLPKEKFAEIAVEAIEALRGRPDLSYEQYKASWTLLPSEVRREPRLIRVHALVLDKLGKGDEAIKEITSALKRNWNQDLVQSFGEVRGKDSRKQLQRAEAWLKQHPEDGVLLVTAARLCMANELWGKARSYLESSLAIEPTPASYALYGKLLDQLGESVLAAHAYNSGLSLASPIDIDLPALQAPAETSAEAQVEVID